jgi:SecD/SecF fusion protein
MPAPSGDGFGKVVSFTLKGNRAADFGDLTQANIGKRLAIVLDGQLVSAPVIQSQITNNGQITGSFSDEEARRLAIVLKSGSLMTDVRIASESFVGPTLGQDAINRGLYACIGGLILVILFMVGYYRSAGFVSALAVILNLLLIMALMSLFNATLTLPGIAGLILTVGMAVDANILIYERIREEKSRGKSAIQSFDHGFDRAYWTILDANITTLIAAIVLFYVGTGAVKGFAVTLSIGILTTLFTSLFATKAILHGFIQGGIIKDFNMGGLFADAKIDFLKVAKPMIAATFVMILIGLGVTGTRWADMLGLDFTGGSMVNVSLTEEVDASEIRTRFAGLKEDGSDSPKYADLEVQTVLIPDDSGESELFGEALTSSRDFQIRVKSDNLEGLMADIRTVLEDLIPPVAYGEFEKVPNEFDTFGKGSQLLVHLRDAKTVEEIKTAIGDTGVLNLKEAGTDFDVVAEGEGAVTTFLFKSNITTEELAKQQALKDGLADIAALGIVGDPFPVQSKIGGAVAQELQASAFSAILFSCILMIGYIGFRFRSVKYGIAAILALVHDVLFCLGTIAVVGMLIPETWGLTFDLSLASIAAFLTVIGYSINDTIVIFDRIRENLAVQKQKTFAEVVNMSINQNLSRTILMSLTTFFTVGILYLFTMRSGGGVSDFAFPLIIGIVVGTYSSIYIASPVMVSWFKTAES